MEQAAEKNILFYSKTPAQEVRILSSLYPGLVSTSTEVSGKEAIIVYDKEADFLVGLEKNPYAHHLLNFDNKHDLGVDQGVRLARAGVSAVLQKGDMNELMEVVSECYREKKNIGFYLSIDPAAKPAVMLNDQARFQVEGFENNYLVGKSPAMEKLIVNLSNAAYYDGFDILVLGENGTGKELVNKALIDNSSRKKNSVILNVASMSDELFKSELMGYKKGAFTGADRDTEGYLQKYNKGLIVFDEIGDLSIRNQATLLRVIQERQAVRLGPAETPYSFDIQFVFSTNKPLENMVKKGEFRLDLFNRLKKQMVVIPPLRARSEDIGLLANHFIGFLNQKYPARQKSVSPDAIELLTQLPWPGNVRELENVLFRCHKDSLTSEINGATVMSTIRGEKYVPERRIKANYEVVEELTRKSGIGV